MKFLVRITIVLAILCAMNGTKAKNNFELKNNSTLTVYFCLGDKEHDSSNDSVKMLVSGKTFKGTVDMSKYPELLVSWINPYPGCKVYVYELDPSSHAKQMMLQVKERNNNDKQVDIIPQNNLLGNNISSKDLKMSRTIYKPRVGIQNPYTFITNFLHIEFNTSKQSLSEQSSPFDLLGLRYYATDDEITKRYNLLLQKIEYLRDHPDMNPLYIKITNIWSKAYQQTREAQEA